jgi:hypothetical protein
MSRLSFNREDVVDAIFVYASQHPSSDLRARAEKADRARKLSSHGLYSHGSSVWEAIDSLEETARPHYFALVEKLEGKPAADELRSNYDRIQKVNGVEIKVTNDGDDPFSVMFEIHDVIADAWADAHGSLCGGTWECPDKDTSFVYDMGSWHATLFDELMAEGYDLDFSEWSDPEEEDHAIVKHWMECPKCKGTDFGQSKKHVEELAAKAKAS